MSLVQARIPYILERTSSPCVTTTMSHQHNLPPNLPVPVDDGACDHLLDHSFPKEVRLRVTPAAAPKGKEYDSLQPLASIWELSQSGLVLLFIYPRSGAPDENVPEEWDAIPGARGCTPQNCTSALSLIVSRSQHPCRHLLGSYRDAYASFLAAGLPPGHLFGCSTQEPAVQSELSSRIHLPYALLSDEELALQRALALPTFEWQGRTLIRRLTLAVDQGKIVKVWYPVFPPDKDAIDVLGWLRDYSTTSDQA